MSFSCVRSTTRRFSTLADHLQRDLRNAIQRQSLPLVQRAIQAGAPINRQDLQAQDDHNDYHIVRASYLSANPIVLALIAAGADTNVSCQHGHTPLIISAERRNYSLVEALLDANAHINHQDQDGNTALMTAAKVIDEQMIKLLLSRGANPDLADNQGDTPLINLCRSRFSHTLSVSRIELPAVRLLLNAKANAALKNHAGETARQLVMEHIASRYAFRQRYKDILQILQKAPKISCSVVNSPQTHPEKLFSSIMHEDLDGARIAIEKGADVNASIKFHRTMLTKAISIGSVEMVKLLLKHNADPDKHDHFGSPLDAAQDYLKSNQKKIEDYENLLQRI